MQKRIDKALQFVHQLLLYSLSELQVKPTTNIHYSLTHF